MRCMTLAEELRDRGADILMLTNRQAIDVVPKLGRSALEIHHVEDGPPPAIEAIANHWGAPADMVVIDHYHWDARAERELRAAARQIFVIDDLADREHDCEFLLDASLARRPADYVPLVPSGCVQLLGPRHALVRGEFLKCRPQALVRRNASRSVERILVSLGLADLADAPLRVIKALRLAGITAKLEVIVGPSSSHCDMTALADANVTLHIGTDDVSSLMAEADMAIGAGGSTNWERCCLGLPSVLIIVADNQRSSASSVAKAGAAIVVEGLLDAEIGRAATELLGNDDLRHAMSVRAAAICDGFGAKRVATAIMGRFRN